ncbi:MAG: lipoprotein [Pseudomonadota bacterium]
MTKMTSKVFLVTLAALVGLAACGLRGGLQRPDPIFRDVTPVERAAQDEAEAVETVVEEPAFNEFGGEIPEAAPAEPVVESEFGDSDGEE